MACCDCLSWYFYNWIVMYQVYMGSWACWALGLWGLFFDDDDGTFMNKCFSIWQGTKQEFPYFFLNEWSKDNPEFAGPRK